MCVTRGPFGGEPQRFARGHLYHCEFLARGDNERAIGRPDDLKRAPKAAALDGFQASVNLQLVPQDGRAPVIDLRADYHGELLVLRHRRETHAELVGKVGACDFDEPQVGHVVNHSGAVGVKEHYLHLGLDGWGFGRHAGDNLRFPNAEKSIITVSVPKVAVVIPSYNHADFIGSALESVAAQSLAPVWIVIVDDGSTDRSLEVIREFDAAHPGVGIVLLSQANAGAHHALNRAISEAGAVDYIAILNSDDLYEPTRLEQCVTFLQAHPDRDVVCTGLQIIDIEGALLSRDHPKARRMRTIWADPARDPAEWLGVSNFAKTTSNFFIRSAYARSHPFRDYRYVHDYFFAVMAAMEGRLGVLDAPLLRYRTHATNTIKADGAAKVARETVRLNFDLLRELAPRLAESPDVRAAYTRYFRTLSGNATDFRVEVFLTLVARLAAAHPEELQCALDALNPEAFPELAAPSCPETRRAIDQVRFDAFRHAAMRSRWTALGMALGLVPNAFAVSKEPPGSQLARLENRFRRSRWLALGRLLGLVPKSYENR